jgi:TonB family protein
MDQSATILGYLASVSVRSLVLFAIAAAAIAALRLKSAAAQHAVWTVVAGGMLLLAVSTPALPPLGIHLLKPAAAEIAQLPVTPDLQLGTSAAPAAAPAARRLTWQDGALALWAVVAIVLLGRLGFGYLFTRRLLRAAARVDRFADTYVSSWITVPMTIGRKVLLPGDWEDWDEPKLQAVLAHERTHVRRADWAIALLSGVNRSVFWFHPLAWWLDRHLATLAEQACDDSALLLVETQPYAQALLDMAAAVNTAQGRLIWEAMAMAKAAEVRKRIERILDETRQIPRAVTRGRWLALLACSLPLIWVASVAQLVPASAQDAPKTPAAMNEFLKGRRQLTQGDVNLMEQYLAGNPHDVDVRAQLILYYYSIGVREPRLTHIVWLIANHPEATQTVFVSSGVLPRDNAMNSVSDFARVSGAWKGAVAGNAHNAIVLGNAAQFYQAVGELDSAESLLNTILSFQPGNPEWKTRLGKLYALAILEGTGDPKFPASKPEFSLRARSLMGSSEDGNLMFTTGSALTAAARRPMAGRPLPPGTLNLEEHPLLQPAVDFGNQLLERAGQFGGPRVMQGIIGSVPAPNTARRTVSEPREIAGVIGSVPSAPAVATATEPLPPIVSKVEPTYPPLARQARIQGVVKFALTIGADGTVKEMQVISGHPLLVPAALEAVKQWIFQSSGQEVRTRLEVNFNLPPGDTPRSTVGNSGKADTRAMAPSAPTTIVVGGNVQFNKLIQRVDPIYPPHARTEGIEGDVTLTVTINEDGTVESAEAIDGNPALAAAAQEAVRQWRYQPTLLNGQPVKVKTKVTVPFQLH